MCSHALDLWAQREFNSGRRVLVSSSANRERKVRMRVLAIVRAIALLSCGLMTGILFGDRMGPAFARRTMSASSFVQQQQIIHNSSRERELPALARLSPDKSACTK